MLEELEKELNYSFRNKETLRNALIHKSYNEGLKKGLPDNEKLEFLGDSVINLVITDYLYKNFLDLNEGDLSKLKAHLVSTNSLFDISVSLKLSDYVFLGKGEEKNSGRANKKINASLLEAVVGAVYLDSNYKVTSGLVIGYFNSFLEKFTNGEGKINDYKSELQEVVQREKNFLPYYKIVDESDKPPNTIFTTAVYIENNEIARGTGKNKRESEQDAAHNALKKIHQFSNYEKLSEIFFLRND
jgi:ribonuclease III